MKKFNLFAIGVVAMLMAAVSVSAAGISSSLTGKCTETLGTTTCTLKTALTLNTADVDDDQTIVTTATNTLTVNTGDTLTIKAGKKLTVDGGIKVDGTIKLERGAKLVIKNAKKAGLELKADGTLPDGAIALNLGTTGKVEALDGAVVEIFNSDKGIFVGRRDANPVISLTGATLNIHDNSQNAMNGGYVKAEYNSVITVNNNGMGGFNGKLEATRGSKLSATGNGFSGVTLQADSSIDPTSSVTSTGNLKGNAVETAKREALKADLSLTGAVTVEGTLTADSVGPEKQLWSLPNKPVVTGAEIALAKTANVTVGETKSFCDDDKYNQATGCIALTSMEFDGDGVAKVGKIAYAYGDAGEVTTDSNIEEVVVTEGAIVSKITVAAGTKVSNLTGASVFAQIEGETSLVEIPKATLEDGETVPSTVTVGTKPEPTPSEDKADYSNLDAALKEAEAVVAEKYTAESYAALEEAVIAAKGLSRDLTSDKQSEVDAATKALKAVLAALVEKTPDKTPSEGEPNPGTLDNVTSVAAMGGISLAIAAAGIATLKKREN